MIPAVGRVLGFDPGSARVGVANAGTLEASSAGTIVLSSETVTNTGTVEVVELQARAKTLDLKADIACRRLAFIFLFEVTDPRITKARNHFFGSIC